MINPASNHDLGKTERWGVGCALLLASKKDHGGRRRHWSGRERGLESDTTI